MTDFHSYGEESLVGLQPLFFRVADRMRLEGYVAALVDDNMSLSLVSGHEAILDHYGKLLVARLREAAPHIGLEVYFPASADALITRFNEVLRTYSIEEAMGNKAPAAQPKIWIVHDASALPDHEIQLLARLVQHFPAANIRVVMLLTTASKKQRLLASFGRRILNWEIEPPSPEQSQVLLEQARAQGREGAVSALLKKIQPWTAPSTPSSTREVPATPAQTEPALDVPVAAAPVPQAAPALAATDKKSTKGRGKRLLWLGVGAGLLGVCALAVLALYGSHQASEFLGIGTRKAVEAAAPPAPVASTPSGPVVEIPAGAGTSAPPGTPAVAAAAPGNALGTAVNPGPSKTNEPAPAPNRSASPSPVNEVEEIIASPSQAQVGQAWVRQMPAGTFMVQHTIVPTYGEATQWLQSHTNLRRARIVATYLTGQPAVQFTVVSGPFASLAEANSFATSPGVPKDPQIRSARSMKDHFAPDGGTQDAPRRSTLSP